jgi:hypothetical protein
MKLAPLTQFIGAIVQQLKTLDNITSRHGPAKVISVADISYTVENGGWECWSDVSIGGWNVARIRRTLSFGIKEFRKMKMQPSLDRVLRRKELLRT